MKRIKSFLAIVACSQAYGLQKVSDIIFILSDDMGYGDVSYLDPRSKIRTDNLDRIARDGVVSYLEAIMEKPGILTRNRHIN